MKEIIISSTEKIGANSKNYIYFRKTIVNNKAEWKGKWFYSSLASCYNDLLEHFTRNGNEKTLKENMEEAVNLLKKLKLEILSGQHPQK